jgi:SAM-dependent methyltransferase
MSQPRPKVNPRTSLRRAPLRAWRFAQRQILTMVARVTDFHFDRAFGSETRRIVETAAMRDVTSANRARGIRYQPTRALPLRRVLRAAEIPTTGCFVDVGCGKGRALMVAVLNGFTRVKGIEYSPELCRAAQRNLDELRTRSGRAFAAEVLCIDAADYPFTPDDSVVFLFNPFDATVLAAVLARLQKSLAEHPRSVWVAYHYPAWRNVMDETVWLEWVGDYWFGGCAFAVYRTRT